MDPRIPFSSSSLLYIPVVPVATLSGAASSRHICLDVVISPSHQKWSRSTSLEERRYRVLLVKPSSFTRSSTFRLRPCSRKLSPGRFGIPHVCCAGSSTEPREVVDVPSGQDGHDHQSNSRPSHAAVIPPVVPEQQPHLRDGPTPWWAGPLRVFNNVRDWVTKRLNMTDGREASVLATIATGTVVLVGFVFWIGSIPFRPAGYRFHMIFPNAAGIHDGTIVRFRGVNIGKVIGVEAETDGVRVTAEVDSDSVVIPRDSIIETNQSGLISEVLIDIEPRAVLQLDVRRARHPKCDNALTLCNNTRVIGTSGTSYDEFVRVGTRVVRLIDQPELWEDLKTVAKHASRSAAKLEAAATDLAETAASAKVTIKQLNKTMVSLDRLAGHGNKMLEGKEAQLERSVDNLAQLLERLREGADEVVPLVKGLLKTD